MSFKTFQPSFRLDTLKLLVEYYPFVSLIGKAIGTSDRQVNRECLNRKSYNCLARKVVSILYK